VVLAGLLALGTLTYHLTVYLPAMAELNRQAGYEAGNLSDLYCRWYPSRELLLHGRDPYSAAMTDELQLAFLGRPARPGETLPVVAVFAQPVYTAFLLAPFIFLDFQWLTALAIGLFPVMVAGGALLWARVLRGSWNPVAGGVAVLLAVSTPATLEVSRVQTLSAPTFLLLAGGVFLTVRRRYTLAGVLLAAATMRPQESWAVIVVLLGWAVFRWRERRALLVSFAATMIGFLVASEIVLPGWFLRFAGELVRYGQNTGSLHVFERLLPGWLLAVVAGGWVAGLGWAAWQIRDDAANAPRFGLVLALALAISQVILPTFLYYEGIYLLPALLVLIRGRQAFVARAPLRVLHSLVVALLFMPWLTALVLLWPTVRTALLTALQQRGMALPAALNTVVVVPWQFYTVLPHLCALLLLVLIARRAAMPGAAAPRP
jgi:hypothetical protein